MKSEGSIYILLITENQNIRTNKLSYTHWVAKVVFLVQILLIFGGRCNRYFRDLRLKIYRLPNFNMLFQLVQRNVFKSELFSCLLKVDHVINKCKRPILWFHLYAIK